MRATILFIVFSLMCAFAQAAVFIFKSGKTIKGEVRYEDDSTIRIMESTGVEMTLRKSELNLAATKAANDAVTPVVELAPRVEEHVVPEKRKTQVKVYTNRDVRSKGTSFVPPNPESVQSWKASVSKLEREFIRLQGACRGAGTGSNLSKVLTSRTYNVQGRKVRVTGYWADPANIQEAKQICDRAIDTEKALDQARRGFQDYMDKQKYLTNALTAQ